MAESQPGRDKAEKSTSYIHPGPQIRKLMLAGGHTVSDAASRLGCGRSALSNFLNGKAAMSISMAHRIEKVFGIPTQDLLIKQALFTKPPETMKSRPVASEIPENPFWKHQRKVRTQVEILDRDITRLELIWSLPGTSNHSRTRIRLEIAFHQRKLEHLKKAL